MSGAPCLIDVPALHTLLPQAGQDPLPAQRLDCWALSGPGACRAGVLRPRTVSGRYPRGAMAWGGRMSGRVSGLKLAQPGKEFTNACGIDIGKGNAELSFGGLVAFGHEHGAGQHQDRGLGDQFLGDL